MHGSAIREKLVTSACEPLVPVETMARTGRWIDDREIDRQTDRAETTKGLLDVGIEGERAQE